MNVEGLDSQPVRMGADCDSGGDTISLTQPQAHGALMMKQADSVKRVAILGTGDMGSAIARELNENGLSALTCLRGRSQRSIKLARAAGMQEVEDLEQLVAGVDLFLSILPPADALGFAKSVLPAMERSANNPVFVDCNAVSPATTQQIAALAAQLGVDFQDGGIIGGPPEPGGTPTRLYTSGQWNSKVQQLATPLIDVKPIGEELGCASAIKMVYASLSKGTSALRTAALLAGEQLGVGREIREEWQRSASNTYKEMLDRIPDLASTSERWAGEMREIAQTYSDAGITPAFHQGAEWIYELLSQTPLASESRRQAREKRRPLDDVIQVYSQNLKSS